MDSDTLQAGRPGLKIKFWSKTVKLKVNVEVVDITF